jgi:hypothetical protein
MKKSKVKSQKSKKITKRPKRRTLKTKKVIRKKVKKIVRKPAKGVRHNAKRPTSSRQRLGLQPSPRLRPTSRGASKKRIPVPKSIHFEASEFPYYSKNREWALAIILFGVVVGILAWWYKMWLLLVIIILAVIVMFQNANKRPKKLSGSINDVEVKFGNFIYPLVNYRSFWIVPDKNESQLYLRPIKKFANSTHIQIPNDRAIEIHQKLLSILPEEQSGGDAIISKINHWFRF